MKKILIFLFAMTYFLCYSQPYSVLLKGIDWTVTKIEKNGTEYLPPFPFEQSGKADFKYNSSNGFKSSFFNSAVGTVDFGANNATYFYVQIAGVTLAEYYGENHQLVNQFDLMTTDFYSGFQANDEFHFDYQEIYSGRNLVVTNPLCNKIFYSNLLLGNNEVSLNKEISIYPNPAKDEIFIKSPNKNLGKVNVEIYDSSGRLVTSQKIFITDTVKTRELPNGVFMVKVRGVGVEYSSKLMIKK